MEKIYGFYKNAQTCPLEVHKESLFGPAAIAKPVNHLDWLK